MRRALAMFVTLLAVIAVACGGNSSNSANGSKPSSGSGGTGSTGGGTGASAAGPAVSSSCTGLSSNVIRGQISKADGSPLPGADVQITNNSTSLVANVTYNTKSDAKGAYCQQVKAEGNSYNIFPTFKTTWQGTAYTLDLHPKDGHPGEQRFTPGKPIVQDYVWQIDGQYGGTIKAHAYDPDASLTAPSTVPQGGTVEVTLAPNGTLIDGSAGKQQVYRVQFSAGAKEGPDVTGVPVGAYTASARIVDGAGRTTPLLVTAQYKHVTTGFGYDKPVAPAQTVQFYFDSSSKLGSVTSGPLPVDLYLVLPR